MTNFSLLQIALAALFLLVFSSCEKPSINDSELTGTCWVHDTDASRTISFNQKELLVDGVDLVEKDGRVFAENGQIWIEDGDQKTYYFDYKLSGNNFFIAEETTSEFYDPSSPTYMGDKYRTCE